jgi:hypothetical protein
MQDAFRTAGRWWKGLLLVGLAGWVGSAVATDVRFVGSVGYSGGGTYVILAVDEVKNYASTPSAALRLELWATPVPFAGSLAGGYQVASYPLSTLGPGASITGISTGIIAWTNPPSGLWYVSMVLTEQAGASGNGGYAVRYWANFPNQIAGSGPPPPPPADTTPPTASITSPTGGTVSGTVTVAASASDNVAVSRVDFYVNGSLVGSDSAAPYQYAWNTTGQANGSATLAQSPSTPRETRVSRRS